MRKPELERIPDCLTPCAWARPHKQNLKGYVVLAVPLPLPLGLAPWLWAEGWHLRDIAGDRGQTAVLLHGGDAEKLLRLTKRPAGHGSYTAGNYLPY